jgi:DNA invertase Pin-like site-specific DNA recombinase
MKLLIYARVSSKDQNVDQQAEYCKKWAISNGHEVVWTIKDKQSGRKALMERERFAKIINNEYNFEYDAVLVYHMDRLTRNWEDVTEIEKYFRDNWEKRKLLSVTYPIDLGSAQGRFMFRLMMAQQCYMPEDMLEKQKIGIERAKKQGKFKGRAKKVEI